MGPHPMRLLDDRLRILNVGASENHMRDWDQQGLVIDRVQQSLGGNGDPVVGGDHMNPGATGLLRLPEIHDRWEVQVAVHHFVASAGEIEAGSHHGLAGSDILVGRNRAGRRIHQRPNLVTHLGGQHPPSLFPCPHTACGPDIRVAFHGVVNAQRHGAQRIADQIGAAFQDGKLRAIAEKVVGHFAIVLPQPGASTKRQDSIRQLTYSLMHPKSDSAFIEFRSEMKAMKTIRNVVGTVGLLYASYILISSMKDVRRYIRMSTM